MQVDLGKLKIDIQEELSKLEHRKSRLEEGLLTVEAVEGLANELKAGEVDLWPTQKTERTPPEVLEFSLERGRELTDEEREQFALGRNNGKSGGRIM